MDHLWPIISATIAVVASCFVILLILRKPLRRRRQAAGREAFPALRPQAEQQFFHAAAASGKPRGLRWKECRFHDGQVFAIDRVSGAQYALVGVTISFEAVEGGPMEDVEAVGNLRAATAVFVLQNGDWTTDGRAVFNLLPEETVERFQTTLAPVE
jgi:hypothetical protein